MNVSHEMWEVISRLDELGLKVAPLREAVRRGYVATASCTANHPPLMRGIIGWGEIVCALREHLTPGGWRACDDNNYALVIDPSGKVAIAVATGDEGTGIREASPSTKSPKGPQTESAVISNQLQLTLDLFGDQDIATESSHGLDLANKDSRITWYLLVHRSQNELRCELSRPAEINDDGRITGWTERIILDSLPLDHDTVEVTPPVQPDLEITVKRRAS
jgi:hypothetical protein